MHDLVIENASVIDGTGRPAFAGSVAVSGGRIAAVGKDVGAGRQRVDAEGLSLMPGIIDNHTHYDAQITWDPYASPSPALGVTTIVMGNCGFTIAPCRPDDRDLVMRNLTHVEGMSLDALRTGIQWEFETFPEYLDFLEGRGVGPNAAVFVGHSSVRTWALRGDAAKRAATPEEVAQMQAMVREAMAVGAVGFSTTTSLQHNGEAGIPMPSRLADDAEFDALASTLAESGKGTLMITKNQATPMARLEALSALAGRPFIVAALLHSNITPEQVFEDLASIGDARARGRRLYGAVSPCPLTFEFNFHAPYVLEGLASWLPAMEAHAGPAYRALLASAEFRAKVKAEIATPTRRMFNGEWERMHVLMVKKPEHKHLEGVSVARAAAQAGKHELDFVLDLALAEDLDTMFIATLLNSDEAALTRMLTDDNALISLSDAGAHLEFFCDAGAGLHMLGHWVRERGIMPIERAVRRLTSEPAEALGIQDRGRIAPGAWADLALIDPATVGRGPAVRQHDLPSGASRLVTPARGVHGVWVNGEQLANAEGLLPQAPLAGQVLRSFNS
ncbi:MAG: amidohydrolase family protein [Burkholderiales bacterium]|nr:amidohydrolase family protein [Burkholderiales bacterium]